MKQYKKYNHKIKIELYNKKECKLLKQLQVCWEFKNLNEIYNMIQDIEKKNHKNVESPDNRMNFPKE